MNDEVLELGPHLLIVGLTGLKSFIFLDSVSSEKFPSTFISSAILFEYQRQSMWLCKAFVLILPVYLWSPGLQIQKMA